MLSAHETLHAGAERDLVDASKFFCCKCRIAKRLDVVEDLRRPRGTDDRARDGAVRQDFYGPRKLDALHDYL